MDVKTIIEKAFEAAKNSYSPYSKFKVGACIEMRDGNYFLGTNIENEIVSPCGACRQVLMELLPQDCPVILANRESYEITTMKELLPRAFIGESLTCSNQDL